MQTDARPRSTLTQRWWVVGDSRGSRACPGARVLQVTPKVDNKFTYRGKVWVSEDDYAVVKIQWRAGGAARRGWDQPCGGIESKTYVRRGDVLAAGEEIVSIEPCADEAARRRMTVEYGTYPVVAARALRPSAAQARGRAGALRR